ncbi:MAG: HAMP domain-containing histidine kinase [Actinomycetota bacterium]|nr:HAMP domain-containing histidine kinase [Actinomycetota bacterium]
MTFRRRLVLATGIAVSVAIVLASVAVYVLVRAELRGQVDAALSHFSGGVFEIRVRGDVLRKGKPLAMREKALGRLERGVRQKVLSVGLPRDPLGGLTGYAQLVSAKGKVIGPIRKDVSLPVTSRTIAVARGEAPAYFSDTEVNGIHARVYTRPAGKGKAVQAARSLEEVDDTMGRLLLVLVLVSVGGIGLALGLALLVGRTAVRPVQRLTEAAEHVASTRDLSRRIEAGGRDELARLAGSFNTMLAALERSLGAQRQLVADASHELRTPLTSLRTNVEVLAEGDRLGLGERRALVADVVAQLEELTALVGDLIDLAREEEQPTEREHLRFDLLVAAAIERARRNHPELRPEARLEPCVVHANASRLDRAVANLLDNARKWSPPGGEVEVALDGGVLEVRDHGPGFAPDDIDHVFDRFYRSPSARRQPGSGLGLAIVRQVAESHGGGVEAANAVGGGGLLRLELPVSAPTAPEPEDAVLATS